MQHPIVQKKVVNLCIDQGNSSVKIGLFIENQLLEILKFEQFGLNEIESIHAEYIFQHVIISSVKTDVNGLKDLFAKYALNKLIVLDHNTPVPIVNNYNTPETLGKDRLAAVVGASFIKPNTDILVIDAGTAITYDFIDNKAVYSGGNIAPGIELRLKALHEFTDKLPKVEPDPESPFLGYDTRTAISSGVLQGIFFEINGYINTLKFKYPELSVFLTGGSTFYFDTKLKSSIFAEKNLVLIGLNRILQFNVQK